MNIRDYIKRPFSFLHGLWLKASDNITAKEIEVSVGDIILQRGNIDHCQFLLSSRMLDVKNYCENNIKNFIYRNTVARAAWGARHKEELGNMHFTSLIESYKSKGYDPTSTILVDCDCRLIDGNHRMGTNLYYHIDNIRVRMVRRTSNYNNNTDWFLKKNIPSQVLKEISLGFKEIQDWLVESGNTFCCYLKQEGKTEDFISDLKLMTNVLRVKPILGGVFVQFSLNDPRYKVVKNELKSLRAIEVEHIIRNRHKAAENQMIFSHSCKEGRQLYLQYKDGN